MSTHPLGPMLRTSTLALAGLCLAPLAHAQHGASDERVSLPEGPGSLEGVGDNTRVGGNMGSMSYAVPIDVPAGFPAVTPNLALAYDSSGPSGVMGIGWDLSMPFVERLTNWGLPAYTADDDFVAGGQIVHIGDGVYRDRFEKRFARHTWHDRGDGTQGWWTTELPDGTVQYFGATADGDLVDDARVAGRDGATFRYHLVEQVDRFGHAMRMSYRTYDGMPHLDRIEYIFTGSDGGPGASLTFEYEDRPDVLIDARSGAAERRTQRLTAVNVFSKDVRIWRYAVHYEGAGLSGGLSRVRRIDRVGLDDTPHPVAFDFEYSQTLANGCDEDCDQPYLVDMGSLGINLAAGDATLADMNGDALPDIIDTSREGAHRVFLNRYAEGDQPAFQHMFEQPYDSETGDRAGHQLSSPYVQTLDANGDGRVDLVNVRTGEVLYNLGTGDWSPVEALGDTAALPDFGDDFAGGGEEPTHVRFFDYDNDRRIDVLRSTLDQTTVYANMGSDGFAVVDDIQAIGAGFEGGLEMADMNGDGLQDAVLLRAGSLSYRVNLGWGRWAAWTDIEDLPFNEAEREFVELQDINGDSLDDLVIVLGDTLRFALNRAGERFDDAVEIDRVQGQALPTRVDGTTVLFADMNGSGSDDVVWISPQGDVTYLELFPVRPNLLTRLTNGLGLVTDITYTTMVEERARAAEDWAYTLPFSMQMVASLDTYDSLNAVHLREERSYADAYYDTEEKAYRGFARVDVFSPADENQEGRLIADTYDVGADDRYRNGLLLASTTYAVDGGVPAPLQSVLNTYADCPVADVPAAGLDYPVRALCMTANDMWDQERRPEAEWVHRHQTFEYDGDGNRISASNLGVVDIGGAGCAPCERPDDAFGAPCGAACEGDEFHIDTAYARSSDRWLLGLRVREARAAVPDSPEAAVTEWYYDGEPFVGLPAGEATLGQLTRERFMVDDDTWLDGVRAQYDVHGNVVGALGPRGDRASGVGLRTQVFDDEHLLSIRTTEQLDGYALQVDSAYDPIWGLLEENSEPRVVTADGPQGPLQTTRFTYDALGQLASVALPGDPDDRPAVEYTHIWGAPVSRIVSRFRTVAGAAAPDQTNVLCRDGFGRDVMQLTARPDGRFEVGGFDVLDRMGRPVRHYRAHVADTDACLLEPPDLEPVTTRHDALGRTLSSIQGDASVHGSPSRMRVDYGPASTAVFAPDDLDADSPGHETPLVSDLDGLGRTVETRLLEAAGAEPLVFTHQYDVRGGLLRTVGPEGDVRSFVRDRLGRVIEAHDPDRGLRLRTYAADGDLIRTEDAAGRVQRFEWDVKGRLEAQWDEADPEGSRVEYHYDLAAHCGDLDCPHSALRMVRSTFPAPDGRAARTVVHDARGRPTAAHLDIGGPVLVTAIEYDNVNRITAVTQPDGAVDRRVYDGANRVTEIEGIAAFEWSRGPLLGAVHLANGLTVEHAYDAVDNPTRTTLTGPDGPLLDLRYAYDRLGRLVAINDPLAPDGEPGRGARYRLDGLGRLAGATLDPGRAGLAEQLEYAHDRRQNLVSKTSSLGAASRSHVGALEYEADRPHVLESAGARSYTHGPAGMLVEQDDRVYRWNAAGRLIGIERGGEPVSRAWHDGEGWVFAHGEDRHVIAVGGGFEVEDGIALDHVKLGARRIATRETAGLLPVVFGDLAPLVDGAPAPDGGFDTGDVVVAARIEAGEVEAPDARGRSLRSMLRGAVRGRLLGDGQRVIFAQHDAARQLVLETDAAGAVLTRLSVDPHGLHRRGDHVRGFEDRRRDPGSRLVTIGARAFDPWAARWVSPDPLFADDAGRLELSRVLEATGPYGFLLDNPIAHTDPSGRITEPSPSSPEVRSHHQILIVEFDPEYFETLRAQIELNDMFVEQMDAAYVQAVRDTEAQISSYTRELKALSNASPESFVGSFQNARPEALASLGRQLDEARAKVTSLKEARSTFKAEAEKITKAIRAKKVALAAAKAPPPKKGKPQGQGPVAPNPPGGPANARNRQRQARGPNGPNGGGGGGGGGASTQANGQRRGSNTFNRGHGN